MTTTTRFVPAGDESESGMAMITAVIITVVVLFLGMTATSLSDHSFSAQRVDRKRVATFHAAEAGIDHALQVLQTTAQASLPCTLAAALGSGAGSGDYSVTFEYFDSAGAPLACPLVSVPRSVLLTSVGSSNDPLGSSRRVRLTANLSEPVSTSAFDKVIFSDAAIALGNSVQIRGNNGNDAIAYTNGNYSCVQGVQLEGYIYAQGNGFLANTCEIRGDIWTKGSILMQGQAVVGRDAISGGSTVTLENNSVVRRHARAATTITTTGSAVIRGLRIPNSPAGDPPTSTFPEVPYNQLAWTNAGYTVRSYTDCGLAALELRTLATTWTTPTLLRITGCRLDITNNSTISVRHHLAIVSDQGIDLSQRSVWTKDNAATVDPELHLIVPYAMVSSCSGTVGNINMANNFEVVPPVRTLVYTPCTLTLANSGELAGQFYGKNLSISQNTTLRYTPVSGIPGYTSASVSSLVRYVVIVYKREVRG